MGLPGRRLKIWFLAPILLAAILLAACHASHDKRYTLEGRVISVNKNAGQIEVDTKAIPNFMDAMDMSYTVQDPEGLGKVASGDEIKAVLVVAEDNSSSHLEKIIVTQKGAALPSTAQPIANPPSRP